MFDEFGKSIDAILVATPDHTLCGSYLLMLLH